MSKVISTLLQDARRSVDEALKQVGLIAGDNGGSRLKVKILEQIVQDQKKKLVKSNKSAGQYRGMFERKQKQCLRLQSEIDLKDREIRILKDRIEILNKLIDVSITL